MSVITLIYFFQTTKIILFIMSVITESVFIYNLQQ